MFIGVAISHPPSITSYWERTRWPLQSLYFLLPLLIIYELGASTYLWERGRAHTAHRMMLDFMDLFGVTGRHLPALVVAAALIAMHIARRQNGAHADTWKPEPKLYLAMMLEAMVLSLPLFVLMAALFREPVHAAAVAGGGDTLAGLWPFGSGGSGGGGRAEQWKAYLVVSIGAGVYEELVFRLIAIVGIGLITKELLALPDEVGVGSAVVLSSIGFAWVHFGDGQPIEAGPFLFYFVTGLYFAAIYLTRGFGLVVATHTLYDVLVFAKGMIDVG